MKKIFVSLLATTLLACGGGGGGAGGSGSTKGIRVINCGIDAPPVTVISDLVGSQAPDLTSFANASKRFSAQAGQQNFFFKKGGVAGASIASTSAAFDPEIPSSLVLFGDRDSFGLNGAFINDSAGKLLSGESAIKFVHAATQAAAIDFLISDSNVSEVTTYGTASGYFKLSSGIHHFAASRSADGLPLVSQQINLLSGKSYTAVVCGEAGLFAVGRVFQD